MQTCVGCGEPLDPAWKYCIHCGIAVGAQEPASTIAATPTARRTRRLAPALILGGIGIILVAIALVAVVIAVVSGSFG